MARIKSAIEIALERTESVKSDHDSVEQYELKREGKRIAGAFLEEPAENPIETALKQYSKDKQISVRRGIFEVLISHLSLPSIKEDLDRIDLVGKGLITILSDKRLGSLFQQLRQALSQYLDDVEQFERAIRQQYAPKLRQKEEELARRTGRRVQIDPLQDPEFVALYNQNMGALKDRYQTALDQVREQVSSLFEA